MAKASKLTEESKALHKMFRDGEIDEQTLDDSMQGLALLPPQDTAVDVYTKPKGLDPYLDALRDEIAEFKATAPSVDTLDGRKARKSMSRKVASLKCALEEIGKKVNDELKAKPKLVDKERKRVWDLMESWQEDILQPVVEWDAEQARIKAEQEAEAARQALLIQIESDHEIALLMYEKHCREQEEAAKAAEQLRIDNEARIAREAAEIATKQAEDAALKLILDAQLLAAQALREKAESEARELQAKLDAELATKLAAEKAERDRLQAIEDERARVAAGTKRLADIKAKEDAEIAKAAANKNHQKKINNETLQELQIHGLHEQAAIDLIVAIARGKFKHITINY